jgi:hypothetical protein
MFCVYHGIEHENDTAFNREHIIPCALGGSNAFSIQVCAKQNSDFGRDIDSPFQDIFPVAFERFIRNIRSADGNLPSLFFRGTSILNGQEARIEYEITAEERKLVTTPLVTVGDLNGRTVYRIQCDKNRIDKILGGIDRKALRNGQKLLNSEGQPVNVATLLASLQEEASVPEISVMWDPSQWAIASQREFVKIALGSAHFLLGEAYSRSRHADLLRTFLRTEDAKLDQVPLLGSVWPFTLTDADLKACASMLGNKDHHLIALLRVKDNLLAVISLFGMFHARVRLAPLLDFECRLADGKAEVITIDPVARSLERRLQSV